MLMNVLSALSLFAILLYLSMGFYIYRLDNASSLNRLFLLWCLSMAVWSFGYAFVYVTVNSQYIWMKISAFGWCFFGAFALHWVLLFTKNYLVKSPVLSSLLYLPGFVFWYLSVFVFSPGRVVSRGIENFFYTGNFIYNFTYVFLCISVLFIRYLKNRHSPCSQKQAKILFASSVCPFLLNLIIQTILPLWGIGPIPAMGHLFSLIMLYGVYYAARHYRLFNISPQSLNDMVFSEMTDLALLLSPDWEIAKVSKSTEMLLGYQSGELLGKPIHYVIEDQSILSCTLGNGKNSVVRIYNETRCLSKTGELIPVKISCLPLLAGKLEEPEGIVLIGHDIRVAKQLENQIEQLKKNEEQISYMAYHDTLTGLANRKYFYERLHLELERLTRNGNKAAILFLDLDGFKWVNDNYGHEAGDYLLKEVAGRMKACIRETDLVARMGGDEFTLLILDIADLNAADAVAQKISDVLDNPFIIRGNPVRIQASIGISIFPDDGGDINLLLNKADNAMYAIKKAKKDKKETLLR